MISQITPKVSSVISMVYANHQVLSSLSFQTTMDTCSNMLKWVPTRSKKPLVNVWDFEPVVKLLGS